MSLKLNPDIEARLIPVVEEKAGQSEARPLSPEQWAAQFEEWADSFPETTPIPDEALSRENLYPDRW